MEGIRGAALAAGASLIALSSSAAWSQDSGFYLGASVGYAEYREICEGVALKCDRKDTAAKIFAGYQVNRYFGVEAAYNDLGEARIQDPSASANISFTAWELVGIASIPVTERLAPYVKLGFYRSTTDVHASAAVPGFAASAGDSERHSDPTYGVGVRFGLPHNLGLRAEWQRYISVGGARTGDTDVDVFSVGLLYRF